MKERNMPDLNNVYYELKGRLWRKKPNTGMTAKFDDGLYRISISVQKL